VAFEVAASSASALRWSPVESAPENSQWSQASIALKLSVTSVVPLNPDPAQLPFRSLVRLMPMRGLVGTGGWPIGAEGQKIRIDRQMRHIATASLPLKSMIGLEVSRGRSV